MACTRMLAAKLLAYQSCFLKSIASKRAPLADEGGSETKLTSLTSALVSQLGLLGSPPDPVGCFPMRGGLSASIIGAFVSRRWDT